MIRYTLVPAAFFTPAEAHNILSEVCELHPDDKISYKELPQYKAVLVYAYTTDEDGAPRIAGLLDKLPSYREYNRIAAVRHDGYLHLCIAEGDKLMMANSFPAEDPVTAEYFIFAALNQFQINPQVSTIHLDDVSMVSMKKDLSAYFKGVKLL